MFLLLTSVSHVGPKLALNVLSGMEVEDLVRRWRGGRSRRLTKIHGVGKKTAERLVLELKDKVKLLIVAAKAASGAPGKVGGSAGGPGLRACEPGLQAAAGGEGGGQRARKGGGDRPSRSSSGTHSKGCERVRCRTCRFADRLLHLLRKLRNDSPSRDPVAGGWRWSGVHDGVSASRPQAFGVWSEGAPSS